MNPILTVPFTAEPAGFWRTITQDPAVGVTVNGTRPAPVAVPLPTVTLTIELAVIVEFVRVITYVAAAAVVNASVVITPVCALIVAAPAVEVAVPESTSTSPSFVVLIDIIVI